MAIIYQEQAGKVQIDDIVIAKIAGLATISCVGIVGMASVNAMEGLTTLLGRENLNRGVRVQAQGERVSVEVNIVVEYGVSIQAVCMTVIDTIQYQLQRLLGLAQTDVRINVQGVRV